MGMSIEKVFKDEDVICRSRGMIYKYTICTTSISIRNKPVQAAFYFDSDRLVIIQMEFDRTDYGAIKEELVEKWGEPGSMEAGILLNKGGTDARPMEWNLPEGQIILDYAGKETSVSTARMTSTEGIRMYREKLKNYLTD